MNRTISLGDRYVEFFYAGFIFVVVTVILAMFFNFNPLGLLIGYGVGTIFWPLFYHAIRWGEPKV